MRRVDNAKLVHRFIGLNKVFSNNDQRTIRIDQNSKMFVLAGGGGLVGHGASLRRRCTDLTAK
ncbi:hypothetical protein PSEUDO8Z_170083 [Pseudomonas sp. 8Z]|nr:hypothetical protein PSEUDO8Z_170083 [Pseudomonas sp. 8Z]